MIEAITFFVWFLAFDFKNLAKINMFSQLRVKGSKTEFEFSRQKYIYNCWIKLKLDMQLGHKYRFSKL